MKNEIKKANYESVVNEIANAPELSSLSDSQINAIAKYVLFNRYAKQMDKDISISQYNLNELANNFLCQYDSPNTIRAYRKALNEYFEYCAKIEISPLQANNKNAIEYISTLRASALSGASIRLKVRALSAFYIYLYNIDSEIFAPIFRYKKLPSAKPTNNKKFFRKDLTSNAIAVVERDFNKTIKTLSKSSKQIDKTITAMLIIMKNQGLRVGAFNASLNFDMDNMIYSGVSKSKNIRGLISDSTLKELSQYNLLTCLDFSGINTHNITNTIALRFKRLHSQGVISKLYTAHDLRHFYAIKEYLSNKDIYALSKKLCHFNIATTEKYLKGLNLL